MHALRFPCVRLLAGLAAASSLTGCGSTTDTIGRGNAAVSASAAPSAMPSSMPTDMPTAMPTAMPPPEKPSLSPLTGPQEYPNPFHDLLAQTTEDIDKKVNDAFEQLFHGDADEVIYYPIGDDAAKIQDVLHGEARSEGVGLAMLICVELGKREEFDKLWTFAKRDTGDMVDVDQRGLRYGSGPNEGYFSSHCDSPTGTTPGCVDPYGAEQFAMALIFAHDVWGDAGGIDYEADALDILNVMKNKQEMNGGIVEDVIDMFDAETHLVFDVPNLRQAQQTRPSILMPAYYALWAEATGDLFWTDAADAARSFFPTVADTKTGLVPLRAYFDGTPVPGSENFTAESYRLFINLVLDEIWLRGNRSGVSQINTVLSFFSDVGIGKYVGNYELDGTPASTGREYALVVANGIAATISKNADRQDYIDAVWKLELPTGSNRYYTGILQLFALLVLSGKMQVL